MTLTPAWQLMWSPPPPWLRWWRPSYTVLPYLLPSLYYPFTTLFLCLWHILLMFTHAYHGLMVHIIHCPPIPLPSLYWHILIIFSHTYNFCHINENPNFCIDGTHHTLSSHTFCHPCVFLIFSLYTFSHSYCEHTIRILILGWWLHCPLIPCHSFYHPFAMSFS